ncbi:MAG: hypothetical protein WAU57_02460 [Xanthobacteraceae bacterium]
MTSKTKDCQQMFKIGASYTVTIVEDTVGEAEAGETDYGGCTIIDVQWPCIKYRQGDGDETILNVSSSRFLRAKLDK